VDETKEVFLPAEIPKGDVMIAFDLTGSMGDELDVLKAEAINIMAALDLLISDAEYGVMSFMDYPEYYNSYGYAATYGDPASGDYAYNLDQPITSDRVLVSNTINALVPGWGADEPQDYARIMYESYDDAAVGWRTGAKRILLMFGDAVPHDDDLNDGYPGPYYTPGVWSTGGDPGRDEVMFTGDDVDLQLALQGMTANDVTLLFVLGSSPYGAVALDYWDHWSGITGGDAYFAADASDVPAAIEALVEAEAGHIDTLTLIAEAGYEAWLTSVVPPEHTDIDIPPEGATRTFDITITVPHDTIPGVYIFHIIADSDGASYGEQEVTITVIPGNVIPEVPLGTIAASTAMIIALVGYATIPKFRKYK
jgi:hypothetical protein